MVPPASFSGLSAAGGLKFSWRIRFSCSTPRAPLRMGVIRQVNAFSETLEVEFDEGRMVEYSFKQLEELELAYAITIHKSQGSEYPAVVIPIYSGPRMLMTRNLIYTAVTRAKKCVCLVGLPEMFQFMVENEMEQKRYSGLKDRILEIEP